MAVMKPDHRAVKATVCQRGEQLSRNYTSAGGLCQLLIRLDRRPILI